MSDTQIATGHDITAEQFAAETFREYLDQLVITKYMGTDQNAMVHVREDLTKNKGDAVTINLTYALDGEGVEGEADLEGSEEAMSFYGQRIVLNEYSNAVRDSGNLTKQRSPFGLLAEFRPALVNWLAQKTEKLFFEQASGIAGTAYGSASESDKDTWLAANSDRVLFGAAVSNNAGNDHDTCLATIDSTSDTMVTTQISLAKRLAQLASPKIRPIRIEGGLEFFVLFAHPYCVRDLKASDAFQNAERYAMPRGVSNPLFTGAVGYWDGVLVVEAPKITVIDNVGAGSIDVAANVLCGAQAFGLVQGAYEGTQRIKMVEKDFDYGRKKGAAIMSMMEITDCRFNSKMHGIVRVYSAAVAD